MDVAHFLPLAVDRRRRRLSLPEMPSSSAPNVGNGTFGQQEDGAGESRKRLFIFWQKEEEEEEEKTAAALSFLLPLSSLPSTNGPNERERPSNRAIASPIPFFHNESSRFFFCSKLHFFNAQKFALKRQRRCQCEPDSTHAFNFLCADTPRGGKTISTRSNLNEGGLPRQRVGSISRTTASRRTLASLMRNEGDDAFKDKLAVDVVAVVVVSLLCVRSPQPFNLAL